jgi:hypothetical protein
MLSPKKQTTKKKEAPNEEKPQEENAAEWFSARVINSFIAP